MMKKNFMARFITVIAAAALFTSYALPVAYGRDGLGVGVIAGEPTGVSVKYWVDRNDAVDAAFAWSLADNSPFQFHADYLIHSNTNSTETKGSLLWYYGIGGRVKNISNETHLGARVPVGVSYLVSSSPVDIFAEVAPVLDVKPTVNFNWNGSIGVRYYFY